MLNIYKIRLTFKSYFFIKKCKVDLTINAKLAILKMQSEHYILWRCYY